MSSAAPDTAKDEAVVATDASAASSAAEGGKIGKRKADGPPAEASEPKAKRGKKGGAEESAVKEDGGDASSEAEEADQKPKKGGKKTSALSAAPSPYAGPAFTVASKNAPAASMAELIASIPAKPEGSFKVLSYNANGLRAALKKDGLVGWLSKEAPDVLCVQETKIDPSLESSLSSCFAGAGLTHCHYTSSTSQKGYAGTAIFSRVKPLSVVDGIGLPDADKEGRCTTAEFEDFIVVNVYVPNSGLEKLERLDWRTKTWDPAFRAHLKALQQKSGGGSAKKKHLVVIGDLNVAFHDMDVHDPKKTRNKTAGFCDAEREGFATLLEEVGLRDPWREANPTVQQFSYYSARFGCRGKNKGWRLDYALLEKSAEADGSLTVEDCFVRSNFIGSDHLPLGIVLKRNGSK